MARPQRHLARCQGGPKQRQRFGEVAACRARFSEVLPRDDGYHVTRLEHLLSNAQRIPVQFFRRGVIAEFAFHNGEAGERGGDIDVLLALGPCDCEQTFEDASGARELRPMNV
jgi:hypothetical protein